MSRPARYCNLEKQLLECSKCGSILPMADFWGKKNSDTGFQSWCKACCNDAQNERRAKVGRPEDFYHRFIKKTRGL